MPACSAIVVEASRAASPYACPTRPPVGGHPDNFSDHYRRLMRLPSMPSMPARCVPPRAYAHVVPAACRELVCRCGRTMLKCCAVSQEMERECTTLKDEAAAAATKASQLTADNVRLKQVCSDGGMPSACIVRWIPHLSRWGHRRNWVISRARTQRLRPQHLRRTLPCSERMRR